MSAERRSPLDRARVADAALRLLNEVGLDGLSLRAIAKELDVKAPALYWHFKDKQALLDEMATQMFRRMGAGAGLDPADTWRERLLKVNRGLRAALLGYRDGAKVFSGSRFTGTDHGPALEANLRLLTDAGLTLAQAVDAGRTVHAYTIGFVTEEQGMRPLPGDEKARTDIADRARRLSDYPLAAAAGELLFDDYDRQFEEGLAVVIAGVGARYGIAP
ncbi:TetR family transcriptional regulator [Streptomyces sp. SID8366]|uniref:TetR/AcrR family transcriptional regulator C-terminal domain-containing protein n=1 Tax=unclassified Streptomyces TaxID=2593676 RepID=UPI000DBA5791|nr:TetR/AcrR family transcriptional regulator C-terminal domain-containing protein [Streptomyces sp. PsTaAH-130]MYU03783.1 TetR family transcriptional regulator [Streptomyces sp. SID8366]MYU67865.1 TetR family transcriptional regulator [Streptomyces sp. SID69]RAJ50891.1 TetR family transcriptional regulator [Streptomyces sp. PsTaAH-130]